MKNSSNALVLYFSLTDNTKRAANTVAEITGADIEMLRLEEPYSDDYTEAAKRAKQEKDQQIIPELRPLNHQLNDYETIYLGFPTWWYQPPMVIHTFFAEYQFSGQTIVPFTTSASSSITASAKVLASLTERKNVDLKAGFTANQTNVIKQYFKDLL